MKPILVILILLVIGCKTQSSNSKATDETQSKLSPGTALSDVLISSINQVSEGFEINVKIQKTYQYGSSTTVLGPNDNIILLLTNSTMKSSGYDEALLKESMDVGDPIKVLIRQPDQSPASKDKTQTANWQVVEIK